MKYRVLTISGQYGSGSARIASLVAARLGWRLVDGQIIDEVAKETNIDRSVVEYNDERVTDWLHRLNREALRSLAMITGAPCRDEDFFDADCMATFAAESINRAYAAGKCVIVGRGAQCILHGVPDTFKVFIYAPQELRLHTVRLRTQRACDENQLRDVDKERAAYIRTHFGRYWQDPELYDLMISAENAEEITASTIVHLMEYEPSGLGPTPPTVWGSSSSLSLS